MSLALAVEGQLERLGSPVTVRRTTGVLDFVTASRGAVTTTDVETVAVRRRRIQRDKEADALFAEELLYLMAARPFSGVFAPADADLVIDGTRSYRVKSVRTRERSGVVIAYEAAVDGGGDGVPVVPAPSGGGGQEVQMFGSILPIPPNTTVYVAAGFSIVESESRFQVLAAGNVTDFGVAIGESLGAGTITATLRKNGVDTALVVVLSGSDQLEYVSGSVAFAKGDWASIKVVTTGIPSGIIVTPSWRFVPTA